MVELGVDGPMLVVPTPEVTGPVELGMNGPVIPLPNPGEGGPTAPGPGGIPVIPLPNPGEGGPTAPNPDEGGIPVIPLPNPGEGGPTPPGIGGIPVIPLPNPGEGGPTAPGPVIITTKSRVRFLNGAYGYGPFHIYINRWQSVHRLKYGEISAYRAITPGYQTISVVGTDGYVYIQKTLPFQGNMPSTVAIVNTASGLDLLQITDSFVRPVGRLANLRVSNLAYYSNPIDVLLRDGRVVYSDVQFKETTSTKRIRPGAYQFVFADTAFVPMPIWEDIETMDYSRTSPMVEELATLNMRVSGGLNYTIFLLSTDPESGAVKPIVVVD